MGISGSHQHCHASHRHSNQVHRSHSSPPWCCGGSSGREKVGRFVDVGVNLKRMHLMTTRTHTLMLSEYNAYMLERENKLNLNVRSVEITPNYMRPHPWVCQKHNRRPHSLQQLYQRKKEQCIWCQFPFKVFRGL